MVCCKGLWLYVPVRYGPANLKVVVGGDAMR